jgi:transposase
VKIDTVDAELRLLAREDQRLLALQTIYEIGPVLACHLLAEIGDARRFRGACQLVRAAGLDPVVVESGETRRRGRLSKQGSPQLRWTLVQAAQHAARRSTASPDHASTSRSNSAPAPNGQHSPPPARSPAAPTTSSSASSRQPDPSAPT